MIRILLISVAFLSVVSSTFFVLWLNERDHANEQAASCNRATLEAALERQRMAHEEVVLALRNEQHALRDRIGVEQQLRVLAFEDERKAHQQADAVRVAVIQLTEELHDDQSERIFTPGEVCMAEPVPDYVVNGLRGGTDGDSGSDSGAGADNPVRGDPGRHDAADSAD